MQCDQCKNANLVEGRLEGVSFVPQKEHRKLFSSGVYGIKTLICLECGKLLELRMEDGAIETLKRMIKK